MNGKQQSARADVPRQVDDRPRGDGVPDEATWAPIADEQGTSHLLNGEDPDDELDEDEDEDTDDDDDENIDGRRRPSE